MPTVQDFLAGNAQFTDINESDWKSYVAEQQKAQQDLLNKDKHAATTMSAMRVRPVVAQATKSKSASSAPVYPTKPGPPAAFGQTDSSSKNKIRFVFADDPFSEVSHYGPNSLIPDAHHYHMIGNEIDRLMVSTRKFTEIAEFWTPLHGKYFDGLVFIIQCMRAAKSTGSVSTQIQDVLDLFEGESAVYPLSSIPVPGPLENTLSCISSSYVQLIDYDPVRIYVPPTPDCTAAAHFILGNNASMRFPPIPLLLNQIGHIHSANLTSAIWRDLFVNPVFQTDLHATAGAPPAPVPVPAYNSRYALVAGAAGNITAQINSPGVLPTFFGANNFTQFDNYRESVSIPAYHVANALPAATLTWIQFLGLHEPDFFQACLRIANIRAKFFKGSVSLSDIQPAGHTGAQPIATVINQGTAANRVSHRFNNVDWTFNSIVQNPLMPTSDQIDSATAPINLSHLPAGTNGHNTGVINNSGSATTMLTHRLGGPFFAHASTVRRAAIKRPSIAYGTTVTAHYYSPVPLKD